MKEEGIVIKSIPYKETSKIVYLYTNKGKISVRAIGSKNTKKNTFGFGESGNIVSFITTDSDFPSLTEYEIINSAYKYVNDFDSIMALGKIIEILNYIPEDSIHNKCYPFVKDILLNLDTNPKKALAIFLINMCLEELKKMKKEPIMCVFNVVRKLREQRYSFVTDIEQYKYIYDFALYWIKKNYPLD
jgi:DNA repair protein RecO (recombination protein O)